jgi:hypothetical protein
MLSLVCVLLSSMKTFQQTNKLTELQLDENAKTIESQPTNKQTKHEANI